ncbi:MAG: DUF86 domain-containing protein [candidate division WOR-3 bacterium]|nr:DUF86 domain-containing protein [candidate division WOR-3 bacterium]
MRSDRERLLDMLEAIEQIEKYVGKGRSAIEQDELLQTWFVHHVQVIGEAAGKLSDEFRVQHPDVPWSEIVAMRSMLVHEYFGVDVEEIWTTVQYDLPRLKPKLAAILTGLPPDSWIRVRQSSDSRRPTPARASR